MPRTWLQIQVDLLGGGGTDLDPPPGRILIVGPSHTFAQLADAIDQAFGRWDLSHLHEFELPDGRLIGYPNEDFAPELTYHDHAKLKVCSELKPGDTFTYAFDLGDNWRHLCTVNTDKADPLEEYGATPLTPVPIWGWGSIPDQYGRTSLEQ